jgi:hypothetical protein
MIANSIGKRFFMDDFIGFYAHGGVHYPDWGEWNRIEKVPPFTETYENRLHEFFTAVARQIEAIYRAVNQIDQVKVAIFDLDDTLWRGIMTALTSKNDHEIVVVKCCDAVNPPFVRFEDFISPQINR